MVDNIETSIVSSLAKINLDEEIAYAIFNETVPSKYKNNPQEFERYCIKKNYKKSAYKRDK
jgi:fructose/tagatose bisphosphate aldolase